MKIKLSLLLLMVVAYISACTGFDPQQYVPGLYTSTPALLPITETPLAEPLTATEAVAITPTMIVTMTVCTNIPSGKLNVRFSPGDNSEVRGYLTESETVTTSGESNDLDGTVWIKLSHPIEGWVNVHYLCEDNNE